VTVPRSALKVAARADNVWKVATRATVGNRAELLTPMHVLAALTGDDSGVAGIVLRSLGVEAADIPAEFFAVDVTDDPRVAARLSPESKEILVSAPAEARRIGQPLVDTESLLLALLRGDSDSDAVRFLRGRGVHHGLADERVADVLASGRPGQPPDLTVHDDELSRLEVESLAVLNNGDVEGFWAIRGRIREIFDARHELISGWLQNLDYFAANDLLEELHDLRAASSR
jgi:ATP-dependent Clp protease ATP-binding subunit ClpA